MPIAKVQLADGRIGRFEVPEGTSPDQVLEFASTMNTPVQAVFPGVGQSLLQGTTFGFADEIQAGIAAATAAPFVDDSFGDLYTQAKNEFRQENEQFKDGHPKTAFAAELAGGITTGGVGAAKVFGANALKNIPNLMKLAGIGGVEGGIAGAGYSNEDKMGGLAKGAAVGVPLGIALPYLGSKVSQGYQKTKDSKVVNSLTDTVVSKARGLGYTLPPAQTNPSIINQVLEGVSGKAQTAQQAAIRNQKVTNNLAKNSVGLGHDLPLNKDMLKAVRRQSGKAYQKIKDALPEYKSDAAFRQEIKDVVSGYQATKADFPDMANKKIDNLIENLLSKESFNSNSLMTYIRQLRKDASINYRSQFPKMQSLGKVQRDSADALENMIERRLWVEGKMDAYKDFVAARQTIAKTHSIDKAMNDIGVVNAGKLNAQLRAGKPLSGDLKTIAQTHQFAPKALQEVNTSMPGISPLDAAVASVPGMTQSPHAALKAASWLTGRPALRSMILSKPYQKYMGAPSYDPRLIPLLKYIGKPGSVGVTSEMTAGVLAN